MIDREELARRLYAASGGDERLFPWPCKRADHYRMLADVALAASSESERSGSLSVEGQS